MAIQSLQKIDVHTHFLPPKYREACLENGHANPDGMPFSPEWSEKSHLQLMDKHRIAKSITSVSTPGTYLVNNDRELVAQVTRGCNTYAADLKRRMPDRFGYWASLPIPDVLFSLDEIAMSANEGCDGYVLLTNAFGHYLGDEIFDPIFSELNKRKATVFIHPTTPCSKCVSQHPETTGSSMWVPTPAVPLSAKYPNPMFEFLFDTARAVSNLFMSGTIQKCPDLKIVLPHLCGATPSLISRFTSFSTLIPGPWEPLKEEDVQNALNRQFLFDLAGVRFPGQIVRFLRGVGINHSRLLYGSD